jgi:hypothetical protein
MLAASTDTVKIPTPPPLDNQYRGNIVALPSSRERNLYAACAFFQKYLSTVSWFLSAR